MIRNYGAPMSKRKLGTCGSEAGKQAGTDPDFIAAVAQRYLNDAHAGRIKNRGSVSKV